MKYITGNAILTFGKYKGVSICDIPATYFINLIRDKRSALNERAGLNEDEIKEYEEIKEYAKSNLLVIKARQSQLDKLKHQQNKKIVEIIKPKITKIIKPEITKAVKPEIKRCDKISYPNEKEAKFKLKVIRDSNQKHNKPVRAYECEVCGGWHLTKIPFENWKK